MTNIVARAHKLAGDPVAALVLLRLAFRYQQALAAGKDWTAQSHENLMDETACSFKQIKRVVGDLKKQGLVHQKQALFANKNVNHYQLTAMAMAALQGQPGKLPQGPPTQALEGPSTQTQEVPPEQTLEGPLYIQGETTLSINTEDYLESEVLTHPAHTETFPEKVTGEVEGEKGMRGLKSVNDLKSLGNASAILNKPDGVWGLSLVWKEKVSKITGAFVSLTAKEMGQLKTFQKHCPPGKAAAVLTFVLNDWMSFAKKVQTMAGIKNIPSQPTIGFLLQFRARAVTLWSPPVVSKHEAPDATCVLPLVQLTSQKPAESPEETPMTVEALLAYDGDDEDE